MIHPILKTLQSTQEKTLRTDKHFQQNSRIDYNTQKLVTLYIPIMNLPRKKLGNNPIHNILKNHLGINFIKNMKDLYKEKKFKH